MLAGRFAESIAQVGLEFIKAGIEANDWEGDIKGSFETSLDSAEETKQALIDMRVMAQNAGLKFEDAGASLKKLFGAGYNRKQSEDIFAAGADVRGKMGGGAEGTAAMQRFIDMSTKIKAMGKVSSRDLVGLTDMGVNPDQLLHTIALMKHTTDEGARKLMESGQLSGGETMNAILDTIQRTVDKGGALGTQAEAGAVGDVDAALNRLHNNVHNALKGLDQAPYADALNKAASLLDENSVAGKRLSGVMQLINGDSHKLSDALLSNGRMDQIFDRGSAAIEKVSKYLQPIIDGALKQLGPALDHIGELWDKAFGGTKGPDEKTTKALELVGELVIGLAEGMIEAALYTVELYEGLSDFKDAVFDKIGGAITWGINKFDELVNYLESTSLGQIGLDLVNGLWDGITGAWTGMLGKFKGLVDLLPDAAKKALGIHSPSTVMADIGVNTAEGFNVGVEKVEPPELAPPSLTKVEHTLKAFDATPAMPAVNARSLGSDAPTQVFDTPRALDVPPAAMPEVNIAPTMPAAPRLSIDDLQAPRASAAGAAGGMQFSTGDINITIQSAGGAHAGGEDARESAQEFATKFKTEFVRQLDALGIGFGVT